MGGFVAEVLSTAALAGPQLRQLRTHLVAVGRVPCTD
jgi:hypothetical protein